MNRAENQCESLAGVDRGTENSGKVDHDPGGCGYQVHCPVWPCGVTTRSGQGDGEFVGTGGYRASSNTELPGLEGRIDVESENRGKTVDQALSDHLDSPPRKSFFSRLEQESHGGTFLHLAEDDGETESDSRMSIVAACVHPPRVLRLRDVSRRLIDREGIDVGAEGTNRILSAVHPESGPRSAIDGSEAAADESILDDARRLILVIRRLWVLVELPSQLEGVGEDALDQVSDFLGDMHSEEPNRQRVAY
jgi:hypothetical protein